jgi:hypothetical protein
MARQDEPASRRLPVDNPYQAAKASLLSAVATANPVDTMFGGSLTRDRATRATDSEGWYSGRAAADLATLHGHRQVSSRSA